VARNLKNGTTATVLEGGFGAQYLTPGYLVYAQLDRLMAVAFDASRVRVTGSPIALQDNASSKIPVGSATNLAIAGDGTALYVAGSDAAGPRRVVWVDRRGTHIAPIAEQVLQFPRYPRLSPDGRRLALTTGPIIAGNIWIYDLSSGAQPLKLTFQDHNLFPIWSSDGQRILFISRAGSDRLLSVPANGSAVEPELVLTTEEPHVPLDWSADGQTVLLSRTSAQTRSDLMLLTMSDRTTRPWLVTPFAEGEARFSPDGRWVAYTSDQTGRSEIWVRPFPGPGAPVRVSAEGGQDPAWSRDGKELFFRSSTKMLSARILSTAPDMRVDVPRALFEGGFEPGSQRAFDVGPDGRFLMIEATTTNASPSIIVVRNWAAELNARSAK
jgi:serine/threonine-protein kinase